MNSKIIKVFLISLALILSCQNIAANADEIPDVLKDYIIDKTEPAEYIELPSFNANTPIAEYIAKDQALEDIRII